MRILIAGWIVLVFCFPAIAAEPKKVALLVGVNTYSKPGFSALKFAERDVEQIGLQLKKLGFSVSILTGSRAEKSAATRANILAHLKELVKPLTRNDVMLVMFSGHGQELIIGHGNGKSRADSFYCPVDAVNRDADSQISLSYVIDEILTPNVGRKLLLIDACRDAPHDSSRSAAKGIQGRVSTLPEDTAVFFSCRAGQQSFENDELRHGLFTFCVFEALNGDGVKNTTISWTNLVDHVSERMASRQFSKYLPEGHQQEPISVGGVSFTVLGTLAEPVSKSSKPERQPVQKPRGNEPLATEKAKPFRNSAGLTAPDFARTQQDAVDHYETAKTRDEKIKAAIDVVFAFHPDPNTLSREPKSADQWNRLKVATRELWAEPLHPDLIDLRFKLENTLLGPTVRPSERPVFDSTERPFKPDRVAVGELSASQISYINQRLQAIEADLVRMNRTALSPIGRQLVQRLKLEQNMLMKQLQNARSK